MADEGTTGAIVLGLVVTGVGVLAINHAVSDPGKSWFDQIKNKLAPKSEESQALPSGTARADERRAYSARATRRMAPGTSHVSIARAPAAPQTTSPETVRKAASQLNAIFGTNFRTDGIVTAEMQRTIKSVQQQLGLPVTGFPDVRLSARLARVARDAVKPSVVTDVTKVISKTFGGPPSTPATSPDEGVRKTQRMLNSYFKSHVLDDDGYSGRLTTEAIKKFQRAEGLQDTGYVDSMTHDLLVKKSSAQESAAAIQSQLQAAFGGTAALSRSVDFSRSTDLTGVAADDSWKAETQDLGQFQQSVIARIISTETNQRTLKSVAKVLGDAGYPKAAAAVLASKAGGAAATTGFFPDPYYGFYPFTHGPWWADPYAQNAYGQR